MVPHLKPRDGRAWGQIALAKVETIDLQPVSPPDALRPIDPQHDLMAGAGVADGAWAFEFHADWTLIVRATRYEHEEIKHTSISRALVRVVLTRSGDVSVQVPDDRPMGAMEISELKLRQATVYRFAEEVVWKFFDHEEKVVTGR